MTKNILSIDFDIIMAPCIKLYNDKVGGDDNSTQLWNYLEHTMELDQYLRYDAKTLSDIALLIKQAITNGAKFYMINEHQEIVDSLQAQKSYCDDTFNITNIDFHHDLWYRQEDLSQLIDFDNYNCSNWLGYLYLKNKTESITWIPAANSDQNLPECVNNLYKLPLRTIEGISTNYDAVYFCLSPQWVPYKYHHLYKLISLLCKQEV